MISYDVLCLQKMRMITIETSIGGGVLWKHVVVGRGAVDGSWRASFASKQRLLCFLSPVQERVKAVSDRLSQALEEYTNVKGSCTHDCIARFHFFRGRDICWVLIAGFELSAFSGSDVRGRRG